MRASMCSDWPSVPMRGSRFAGLLSMSMVTKFGAAGCWWHAMVASERARLAASQVCLRIGYLPEERRPGCSGSGGNIAGTMVPGLPSEEREGRGLLGLRGKPVIVAGGDAAIEGLEDFAEHGYEREVARAAPGEDVIDSDVLHAGLDESAVGDADAMRGERSGGGDGVLRARALPGATGEEILDEGGAELFAACALGRWRGEEAVAEKGIENTVEDTATRGYATTPVIGFLEERLSYGVDDHVRGAGVEGKYLRYVRRWRNGGEVADAAEVLQYAAAAGMAEDCVIKKRNQRRALASGEHVCGAKVGDHGDAGFAGEHSGFADLPGAGEVASCVARGRGLVIDSLAVAAD